MCRGCRIDSFAWHSFHPLHRAVTPKPALQRETEPTPARTAKGRKVPRRAVAPVPAATGREAHLEAALQGAGVCQAAAEPQATVEAARPRAALRTTAGPKPAM